MIQQIQQRVSIEPIYLDSDIQNHILNKLKQNMEGTCTLDTGYIIDVKRIISMNDNTIGCANSLVIFNVIYEAVTIKPCNGSKMTGNVCLVFPHGILVYVRDKMKVLIPTASMENYTFNTDNTSFESDEGVIEIGSKLYIEIVLTKYEQKQFSCIGKLITEDMYESERV